MRFLLPIVAIFFAIAVFSIPKHFPNFTDLDVYLLAGEKAAQHQTVYDVEGHYQFKYSPLVAVFFSGFSNFDKTTSYYLFYFLSVFGWVVFLVYLLKWIRNRKLETKDFYKLIPILCLVFILSLRDELKLGQINLVPFALLFILFSQYERFVQKRWFLGGAFYSIAVLFKLYSLSFLPFFIFKKKWKFLFGFIGTLFLLQLGTLSLFHGVSFAVSETFRWIETLSQSTEGLLDTRYNVSLLGESLKFGFPKSFAYLLWVMFGSLWTWYQFKTNESKLKQLFSIGLVSILVLNPLSWPNWMLFLLPLTVLVLEQERDFPKSLGQSFLLGLIVGLLVDLKGIPFGHVLISIGLIFFLFRQAPKKLGLQNELV